MAKRRALNKRSSRKLFRKGNRVHKKNGLAGNMRGGIRF